MKYIKLFETWYSDLPQTMKMEDIKKLSPDDFLKLGKETLERGKGTDQNEFWTIWKAWLNANFSLIRNDAHFIGKLGRLTDGYDLKPDDVLAFPPVMGHIKKEELEKEIERVEREILRLKDPSLHDELTPEKIEAQYQQMLVNAKQRRKDCMDFEARYQEQIRSAEKYKEMRKKEAKKIKPTLAELEKELAELKSEREKFKF